MAEANTAPQPSQARCYQHPRYQVRKKFLKLFGGAFHIFAPDGSLAFYSEMKAFRLKEDIRIYADESKSQELILIKARNIIDFSATYDVVDATTLQKVGALRRKGVKSILKDEWVFLDIEDQEIGLIQEDSMGLAVLRRMLCNLIPQRYHGTIQGQEVCHFQQNFNPFILKIELDFSQDKACLLDRRLGIAAAVLLCAIEGRQE
jgi:hypothetical protein